MMLEASGLHKVYGDKLILDDERVILEEGGKYALIGVNGCGKSTLLKMLAGEDDPVSKMQKKDTRIHLMTQTPEFKKETVWEEMVSRNAANRTAKMEYELQAVLTRLELTDFSQKIENLSGGQKRRLSLAAALISDAEILFLDEPTNHLDNDMIQWLENELKRSSKTILMVTHDRYFLENVCTGIFELDHGRIYEHKGSYEEYLQAKQIRLDQQDSARKKLENIYRKELAWVRAGVQARSTKSKARLDRFEELRAARKKQQEQILELNLQVSRMGTKTIEWKNVAFGWDKTPLFRDFSYHLKRNDRIGLIGPNGCGKTTFLKLLAQELTPTEGVFEIGDTVRMGFFRQDYSFEDLSIRVIDYLEKDAAVVRTTHGQETASSMLERFMFDKGQHYLPVERLSGGERRRLYLLKVLLQAPNVLILDEPTNDLDLMTLEILEDYLDDFPGIVVTVSHDRYFLDRICDFLFVHQDDLTWQQHIGGYSDLLVFRENAKAEDSPKQKPSRQNWKVQPAGRLNSREKRRLKQLPEQMEKLEAKIAGLNEEMNACQDFKKIDVLSVQRDELDAQLADAEMEYLELLEKEEKCSQ
ncbi:MAG: ABC-F family ATP-binding cassette domain-containing protein [Erysipelotrichaceae bacterium]|nr:ABC-F family ATP-binding cassette domain-containing protein [Erysipelotrichaceae bacterium]